MKAEEGLKSTVFSFKLQLNTSMDEDVRTRMLAMNKVTLLVLELSRHSTTHTSSTSLLVTGLKLNLHVEANFHFVNCDNVSMIISDFTLASQDGVGSTMV